MRDQEFVTKREAPEVPGELFRSIMQVADGGKPTGLIANLSKEMEALNSDLPFGDGIKMPLSALTRGLSASTANLGGNLIGFAVEPLQYELRAQSRLVDAGAQVVTGLTGNLVYPRELTQITFSWLKEGDSVTAGTGSLGAMALSPHRISGLTSYTKQLLRQAPAFVENNLPIALSRGLMEEFEKKSISGTGIFGQPTGVQNTAGISTISFGGAAATHAKTVEMERLVSNANATPTAFIADPLTRSKWRSSTRTTNSSKTLWDDDDGVQNVLGYPAIATNVCPPSSVILGAWSAMVWAFWGQGAPVELLVDFYSSKKSEGIEILATAYADIGILQPSAFCASTDSSSV
jgi:HK97 family phage major capsid protein